MSDAARRLALRFLEAHPEEGASLLESRPSEEAAAVLLEAGVPVAAQVLRRGVAGFAAGCLEQMEVAKAAALLDRVPAGEAAAWLRRVDAERRESWLAAMGTAAARAVRRALPYAEGTAGALMDATVSALPSDLRVTEAVELLRREPQHSAYYLYVVAREGTLLGVVNYRDLLLAEPGSTVSAVMRSGIASLPAASAGAELLGHPAWRRFLALPVVDDEGRLVGALRHDTVLARVKPPEDVGDGGRSRPWWRFWRRGAPSGGGGGEAR